MTLEIIHDQTQLKYGTGPGSNSRPLDLQSDTNLQPDMLPTALRCPAEPAITGFSMHAYFDMGEPVILIGSKLP